MWRQDEHRSVVHHELMCYNSDGRSRGGFLFWYSDLLIVCAAGRCIAFHERIMKEDERTVMIQCEYARCYTSACVATSRAQDAPYADV